MNKKNSGKDQALFPLKGYLILNAVFWAYCLIQIVALTWLFKDIVGIVFFFVVLGIAFTLVSVYDYSYDRLVSGKKIEKGEK